MTPTRLSLACLALLVAAAGSRAGTSLFPFKKTDPNAPTLPADDLPEPQRAVAKPVLDRPTLAARGPVETFACHPEHYYWFLDHPDRAVVAWRRLGAKCVTIQPRGDGRFGWSDELGSDIVWQTIHRGPGIRVWYAEGKVRPTAVMPLVPVKAVVVLRHRETTSAAGAPAIRHSSDLFVQTDSRAAAAVTKLMGQSAPRLAEQGLGQLQLFFSGLAWYLDRHPEHAAALLREGEVESAVSIPRGNRIEP
jgi:hypothetical protein